MKLNRARGKFLVRRTKTPEYDAKRNWSGWMRSAHDSYEDVVEYAYFSLESPWESEELDMDEIWHKYQTDRRIPLTEYDRDDSSDPDFLRWFGKERGIDVRYHEKAKKWMLVDHEGLSGYRIDARTYDEAIQEAIDEAIPMDKGILEWGGTIEDVTSVGWVRYVGPIPGFEDYHLFEAQDVITEVSARSGSYEH